ncbi:hypothetical protein HD593_006070 [Nonomuraea rubra]|uniref:Uncharacterized protein n=1 Tax=Nonomuraea rubra TaxID=46180 RepID=A0A7X0NX85_9ACTN|nr:hypothetical protein [Nonomuraea rubra]
MRDVPGATRKAFRTYAGRIAAALTQAAGRRA